MTAHSGRGLHWAMGIGVVLCMAAAVTLSMQNGPLPFTAMSLSGGGAGACLSGQGFRISPDVGFCTDDVIAGLMPGVHCMQGGSMKWGAIKVQTHSDGEGWTQLYEWQEDFSDPSRHTYKATTSAAPIQTITVTDCTSWQAVQYPRQVCTMTCPMHCSDCTSAGSCTSWTVPCTGSSSSRTYCRRQTDDGVCDGSRPPTWSGVVPWDVYCALPYCIFSSSSSTKSNIPPQSSSVCNGTYHGCRILESCPAEPWVFCYNGMTPIVIDDPAMGGEDLPCDYRPGQCVCVDPECANGSSSMRSFSSRRSSSRSSSSSSSSFRSPSSSSKSSSSSLSSRSSSSSFQSSSSSSRRSSSTSASSIVSSSPSSSFSSVSSRYPSSSSRSSSSSRYGVSSSDGGCCFFAPVTYNAELDQWFCTRGTMTLDPDGNPACWDCSACYSSSSSSRTSDDGGTSSGYSSSSSLSGGGSSGVPPWTGSSSSPSSVIICGNGRLDLGEECDDGNIRSGDGCSKLCRITTGFPPQCGNGLLELGEQCDHGQWNGIVGDGCSSVCAFVSTVGNGILEPGEECDDGNLRDGDGCDHLGRLEPGASPSCGDAVLEPGEECDHGTMNGIPGEGCTVFCRLLGIYGNGVLDPGEECDDGNTVDGDGCDHNGRLEPGFIPRCGDSILEIGEECDEGTGNGVVGSTCDGTCRLPMGGVVGKQAATTTSPFDASLLQQQYLEQLRIQEQQRLAQQQLNTQLNQGQSGGNVGVFGKTGPATIAIMAAGAATGIAWMRRKKQL